MGDKQFNYLLCMRIDVLTLENARKIEEDMKKKRIEFETIVNKEPTSFW